MLHFWLLLLPITSGRKQSHCSFAPQCCNCYKSSTCPYYCTIHCCVAMIVAYSLTSSPVLHSLTYFWKMGKSFCLWESPQNTSGDYLHSDGMSAFTLSEFTAKYKRKKSICDVGKCTMWADGLDCLLCRLNWSNRIDPILQSLPQFI